jgi:signal transduction histidine kinase
VGNAIKYTPAGGTVTVKAAGVQVRHGRVEPQVEGEVVVRPRRLAPGSWLAIQVADTGRGIAPEDLGRVFERFYRADRARAEAAGSGLGLSIVREIVVAHGGAIAVRSAPGQGATFTILVPA